MIRKLVFLQDSLTGDFYTDHTGRLGSFKQATIYTDENYSDAITSFVKHHKFYVQAIERGAEIMHDCQRRAMDRKDLKDFGIHPRIMEIDLTTITS